MTTNAIQLAEDQQRGQASPKEYRASAANLYAVCPGAAYTELDDVLVDPVDDAGTIGRATHDACKEIILDGDFTTDRIVAEYGLDEDQRRDLIYLAQTAAYWWKLYRGVFVAEDGVARVHDWKTTRLETVNYRQQMMQYLWILCNDPNITPGLWVERELRATAGLVLTGHVDLAWLPERPTRFQYTISYLRDRTEERSRLFTPEDLRAWHDEYVRTIKDWDGKFYHPGGHCHYCPRSAVCPALMNKLALAAKAAEYAPGELLGMVNAMTQDSCIHAYERFRLLEKALAGAIDIIKLRAEREGGILHGDGKALVLVEKHKQTIKAREAWPVIKNGVWKCDKGHTSHTDTGVCPVCGSGILTDIAPWLDEEELAPCVTINKGDLLEAIGENAPKGQKGKAKKAMLDELEAAQAIETSTYTEMRLKALLPGVTVKELEGGNGDGEA